MHIGRLIARLNPSTVRYDVGSGGIPDLTPQDVAAALGMVRDPLGAALLCVAYGDAGAGVTSQVYELLRAAQRAEWWDREQAMMSGLLAIVEHTGGESLRRAQRLYADAHARRWPRWLTDAELGSINDGYRRVRLGVLAEVQTPLRCHACGGRGTVADTQGLVSTCGACRGTGYAQASARSRALLLGVDEAAYRRRWSAVYEWTSAYTADTMASAAREAMAALA